MTLKRFLTYSLIIHSLFAVFFLTIKQQEKEREATPLSARLITPEELGEKKEPVIPAKPPARRLSRTAPSVTKEAPHELSSEQSAPSEQHTARLQSSPSSQPGSSQLPGARGGINDVPYEEGVVPSGKGSSHFQGKANLFDREEIAKVAKKADEQEHKTTFSFDTDEFKSYGYMQRLKEKIEGIWRYPTYAAEKGLYGDLLIDFTIRRDGSLGSVELVRTSGYRILDDAAIKALKEAAPYWPLPEGWKKDALTITGHFIYTLYGTSIW